MVLSLIYSCKSLPAYYYDKLDTVRFNGREYPVPSDTHNYLSACYGDWHTQQEKYQTLIDDLAIADKDSIKSTPEYLEHKKHKVLEPKFIKLSGKYNNHMRDMLFYIIDLFEKHNIKFWLDDGTLLGIIREGNFIPWDHDVDLGVDGESISRILNLKYQLFPKYLLKKRTSSSLWVPGGVRVIKIQNVWKKILNINFHIDLFTKYKVNDKYQWIDSGALKHIECKYYDNLDSVQWMGRTIPIPSHTDEYLSIRYGDWQTPIKDFDPSREDGAIAEKGF